MTIKQEPHTFKESVKVGDAGASTIDDLVKTLLGFDVLDVGKEIDLLGVDRICFKGDRKYLVEYKTEPATATTGNVFVETISQQRGAEIVKTGWANSCAAQLLMHLVPNKCFSVVSMVDVKLKLSEWQKSLRSAQALNVTNSGEYTSTGYLLPLEDFQDMALSVWDLTSGEPKRQKTT